jgi:hypothetical protein
MTQRATVHILVKGEKLEIKCSEIDKEAILAKKWHLNHGGYLLSSNADKDRKSLRMHHFVICNLMGGEIPEGYVVDHINGDKLDNSRENLRVVTKAQNSQNRKRSKPDGYYGVKKHKKKYITSITHNYKNIHIGSFDSEIQAAEAYDDWVFTNNLRMLKPINFPDRTPNRILVSERNVKPPSSNFIGVRKSKGGTAFSSRICHDGKQVHLITSRDEIECAKAYDDYVTNHGLKRQINFPKQDQDTTTKTYMQFSTQANVGILALQNETVLIDIEDYEKVSKCACTVVEVGGKKYVNVRLQSRKLVRLHRLVMNATNENLFVDHINGNGLDCRKENLRIVTAAQNSQNRKKTSSKMTSKYIGVFRASRNNKFYACVNFNGKIIYRKMCKDEEHAARARDLYIIKNLSNEIYKLNFGWSEQDKIEWEAKLAK